LLYFIFRDFFSACEEEMDNLPFVLSNKTNGKEEEGAKLSLAILIKEMNI